MTHEEAAKIIRNIPDRVYDLLSAKEFEAVKLAVEVLEGDKRQDYPET